MGHDADTAPSVHGAGCIVLAAYEPAPELFIRQVRSIAAQTVRDFTCLITADSDPHTIRELLVQAVSDDARFRVIGDGDRLGFYGNFERGLAAVPQTASWVALSDQDDFWYPNKLEILLPHLKRATLVCGQARVVQHPTEKVIAETTARANVPLNAYFQENQFTGGQTVFRASLLSDALPFPRLRTPSEVHDHWLAVVAGVVGTALITEHVVQDYVQHGANVIGEAETGFRLTRSLRTAQRTAQKYEDSSSPRAIAQSIFKVGVGWSEVMAVTLSNRFTANRRVNALAALFGPSRRAWRTWPSIVREMCRRHVSLRSTLEYFAGWIAGSIFRLRKPFTREIGDAALRESRAQSSHEL